MSSEAIIAAGYALALLAGALILEWLSAHTHRRSLRYRTAGFEYSEQHDAWVCPEGEHLWLHEHDHEHRVIRYRAKAHVCNACPVKDRCTDSDEGREIVQPMDPWPHSEAGRFHRVISLMLVALAALVAVVALTRNHQPADIALLGTLILLSAALTRVLQRDLRKHPANFPEPSGGLQTIGAPTDGGRVRSRGPVGAHPSWRSRL
jgi:Transposase DDE domain